MNVQDRFLSYTREHRLIGEDERVLVGLSGGPDSVCLFHLVRGARARLRCSLFAAHLDHGIRPESGGDLDFCRELCRRHRVPFAAGRIELGARAGENEAREARYDFLARAAGRFSCHAIATGHNMDDQAETVMMRLIRGTGLQGLAGIAPARELRRAGRRVRLVRPLLDISRADIEAFLSARGHSFVTDASNRETAYRRNLIRRELIPLLQGYNPAFRENIARLADMAAADYRFISGEAARLLRDRAAAAPPGAARGAAGYRLPRREFAALPLSLQRETLRRAIAEAAGSDYRPGFTVIEQARRFCLAARAGTHSPCPGVAVRRTGREIEIAPENTPRGHSR